MKKDAYIELIYKSFSEKLSEEERSQLDQWLAASEENRKEATVLENIWQKSAEYSKDLSVDLDQDFALLQNRIEQSEMTTEKPAAIVKNLPTAKAKSWWTPLSIAAAVLLLAGAFFVMNRGESTPSVLMASTQAGETVNVSLADGSTVWLNENSSLTYFKAADGAQRNVELEGEAFFEVSKNPNQPFVISTKNGMEVKVLGTSFQVSAYPNQASTEVVVKTGKVSFGKKEELKPMILTANQRGTFDTQAGKYTRGEVENFNAISWQNKVLDFSDIPLSKVIADVEKHFDLQLTLVDSNLAGCKFGSIFNQPEKEQTLQTISNVFKMKLVKVNENNYRLEGGECINTTE